MITEKRLKELIQQRATIWCSSWEEEVKLSPENCVIDTLPFYATNSEEKRLIVFEDDKKTAFYSYRLQFLEEDVEKGAWDYEMHATRVEEFEPPYKLNIGEYYEFTSKKGCRMRIRNWNDEQYWVQYVGTHTSFNTYKEAAEYARKMFLGEK